MTHAPRPAPCQPRHPRLARHARLARQASLARRLPLAGLLASGLVALALGATGTALALDGPYPRVSPPRAAAGTEACEPAPPAVVALRTVSKYRQDDPSRSRVDEAAQSAFRAQMEPVERFAKRVVAQANRAVAGRGGAAEAAACALSDLAAWARAGALTRLENDKAYDTQGKTLASLALAYLQVREAGGRGAGPPETEARAVEAWLAGLADALRADTDARSGASARNNHRYWSGLGVAAAGVAAGRRDLLVWGFESARIGLRQVQPDGTLPLELARGARAAEYHLYAVAPLVLTAEIAARNGVDLYAESGGALGRLAARALRTFDDPADIARATGTAQATRGDDRRARGGQIAWLEAYDLRFPSEAGAAALGRYRPVSATGLGGNQTLLYRGPAAARAARETADP